MTRYTPFWAMTPFEQLEIYLSIKEDYLAYFNSTIVSPETVLDPDPKVNQHQPCVEHYQGYWAGEYFKVAEYIYDNYSEHV